MPSEYQLCPALLPALSALFRGRSGGPAGGTEEEWARPERARGGPSEPQILQDIPILSLAEVFQVSVSLPSSEEVHPCHPTELSGVRSR